MYQHHILTYFCSNFSSTPKSLTYIYDYKSLVFIFSSSFVLNLSLGVLFGSQLRPQLLQTVTEIQGKGAPESITNPCFTITPDTFFNIF